MSVSDGDRALVRDAFASRPARTYADTASYGLPPHRTIAALRQALSDWRDGAVRWPEWDVAGDACRESFARLCGADPAGVALLPAVSVATGLVAASLEPGATVLVADDDFTSVLFPLLVAERRGVRVRAVPFDRLADEVKRGTSLVAASLVHSATGARLAVADVAAACAAAGARLYLDVTQALGAVPLGVPAQQVDYIACAAYKFLLSPRGVAFLYVRPGREDEIAPLLAGWRSADEPYARFYGGPLTLPDSAARFDVSLAWHSWVGARESLELLSALDGDVRHELAATPARRLASVLGVAEPESTIVSVPVADTPRLRDDLARSDVVLTLREGLARASFHVYNTDDDADRVAAVLRRHLHAEGVSR